MASYGIHKYMYSMNQYMHDHWDILTIVRVNDHEYHIIRIEYIYAEKNRKNMENYIVSYSQVLGIFLQISNFKSPWPERMRHVDPSATPGQSVDNFHQAGHRAIGSSVR